MADKSVPAGSPTDEFGSKGADASLTDPSNRKTADARRDELKTQENLSKNVQMRHKPTGHVTTYARSALDSGRLYVPELREDFPLDQFEEFKERGT